MSTRTCQNCTVVVKDTSMELCPNCGEFLPAKKTGRVFLILMVFLIIFSYTWLVPGDQEMAAVYIRLYTGFRLLCLLLIYRRFHDVLYASVPVEKMSKSDQTPEYKLFSPGQVAWAAFWGTPVAGFVILGLNYLHIGRKDFGHKMIGMSLVACLVNVALLFLPTGGSDTSLHIALMLLIWFYAKHCFGAMYDQHIYDEGLRASSWAAFGIGLFCALISILVCIVAVIVIVWCNPELITK